MSTIVYAELRDQSPLASPCARVIPLGLRPLMPSLNQLGAACKTSGRALPGTVSPIMIGRYADRSGHARC